MITYEKFQIVMIYFSGKRCLTSINNWANPIGYVTLPRQVILMKNGPSKMNEINEN